MQLYLLKKVVVKSLYAAVSFNNLPWRALLLEIYFWNAWIFGILRLFFIVIHHFCMAGVFKPHFSSHSHIYSNQWLLHWKTLLKIISKCCANDIFYIDWFDEINHISNDWKWNMPHYKNLFNIRLKLICI